MTTATRSHCLRLGCLAIWALFLSACSSAVEGPGGRIGKVKYYHLMPNQAPRSQNPAILFEYAHHLHGAVTQKQVMERFGHYYTVFWQAKERTGPVTVRLEYQQANSGLNKRVQEQVVDDLRGSNLSKFQVGGAEYHKSGRVVAWRVSILRGKEELVSQQSALWN